jgi:hypothetical protein
MSTSAVAPTEPLGRREEAPTHVHLGRFGIGTAGLIAVLVSAWGGIVPFVGPLFDYSGDGSAAWEWNLAHAVLALLPGVAGVLLGLFVVAVSRGVTVARGRLSLAAAGLLLMVCGAWFVIGPVAWPVISDATGYLVGGTHLHVLERELGYSLGTGVVLVACGAFVVGWASRHQPKATAVREPAVAAPAAPPVAAETPAESDGAEPPVATGAMAGGVESGI